MSTMASRIFSFPIFFLNFLEWWISQFSVGLHTEDLPQHSVVGTEGKVLFISSQEKKKENAAKDEATTRSSLNFPHVVPTTTKWISLRFCSISNVSSFSQIFWERRFLFLAFLSWKLASREEYTIIITTTDIIRTCAKCVDGPIGL